MTTSQIVGLIAVVIYSIITLIIGLGVGYKKEVVSSTRGYFIGTGTRKVILFFTTLATCFSTWIFMGAPRLLLPEWHCLGCLRRVVDDSGFPLRLLCTADVAPVQGARPCDPRRHV